MSEEGSKAFGWWRYLTDPKTEDRASLAKLRRCENAVDAASTLEAIRLARALGCSVGDSRDADKALELAILLAHVRENEADRPMRAVGWKGFPGSSETEGPVLSELRFQRLLQTTPNEKLEAFKRLVRLTKGKANVAALATDFWFWGDAVKKRWAFDYYNAANSQMKNEGEPV